MKAYEFSTLTICCTPAQPTSFFIYFSEQGEWNKFQQAPDAREVLTSFLGASIQVSATAQQVLFDLPSNTPSWISHGKTFFLGQARKRKNVAKGAPTTRNGLAQQAHTGEEEV
jgi:hypothetical protein